MSMLRSISNILIDILFPPLCIQCRVHLKNGHDPICAACYDSIAKNTALVCPICATRLANNKRACRHGKQDVGRFPYILGAASHYTDPVIKNCIHACKYEGMHSVAKPLTRLLITYARQLRPQPAIFATQPVIVPIPLHPAKERKRGFNQSAIIARSFADHMGFAYDELLMKLVNDEAQAQTKTHRERFERMRDIFITPRPQDVMNKNIILIDDVSTSGATLSEAARTLKSAGARHILALVIAKA